MSSVEAELDELESEAEDYKRVNKFNEVGELGTRFLQQSLGYEQTQVIQKGQLELLAALEQYIKSPKNLTDIIPTDFGVKDATLSGLVAKYNQAVLDYQQQAKISTAKDPVLGRMKGELGEIRSGILKISAVSGKVSIWCSTRQKPKRPSMIRNLTQFPKKNAPISS